ncbi:hypothetical protein Tco_0976983 [Tanacetum coccineum]|uniref:Uncharacterized protein n=1 Tax=Tanacetum coccineum TaxID=301880 RepID=A0ABQ5EIR8_9ASTR
MFADLRVKSVGSNFTLEKLLYQQNFEWCHTPLGACSYPKRAFSDIDQSSISQYLKSWVLLDISVWNRAPQSSEFLAYLQINIPDDYCVEPGSPVTRLSEGSKNIVNDWGSSRKCTITPFYNSVLLRSSRNRLLMKYANTFIELRHNLVDEFCSVICADESDGFVEANLYLLKKVGDKL